MGAQLGAGAEPRGAEGSGWKGMAVRGGSRNRGPSFCFCLDRGLHLAGWGVVRLEAQRPQREGPAMIPGQGGSGLDSLAGGVGSLTTNTWQQPTLWPCSLVWLLCPVSLPWASGTLHSVGLWPTGETVWGCLLLAPQLNL